MSYRKPGVTLTEVLIGVALVAILVPLVLQIYTATIITSRLNSAQLTLQLDGRRAIAEMSKIIKQGKAIAASGGSPTKSTSTNTVVVNIPGVDTNQNLLATNDTVVFFYDAPTKQLKQNVVPTTGSVRKTGTTTLSSNVDSLTLGYYKYSGGSQVSVGSNYNETQLIRVDLTLKKPVGNRQAKVTLSDEIRLRNK